MAALGGAPRKLAQQARLPDPGLAAKLDRARRTVFQARKRAVKDGELFASPDEPLAHLNLHGVPGRG